MNYAADPKTYFFSMTGQTLFMVESLCQKKANLEGFELVNLQTFKNKDDEYDAMLIYKIWKTE
jgi:hypothetical protein